MNTDKKALGKEPTECPTCGGTGTVDATGYTDGTQMDCPNSDCKDGFIGQQYEIKEFGQLKVGDEFISELDNRTLVFKKSTDRAVLDNAVVHRDPKGVYTGIKFSFGLLAPVKVEKKD